MNKEIKHSVSRSVNAPAATVWSVLLSPRTYKEIWQADFSGSWAKGQGFALSGSWDGVPYQDKCKVTNVEDGKSLEYTYWSSFWDVPESDAESCTIKYEVEELDEHSARLTITQTGFRDDLHHAESVKLWEDTASAMKNIAER